MYANMRVTIAKKGRGGRPRTRSAHLIVVTETEVIVKLDANEGGSYAVDGGEERYPRKGTRVQIEADF